MAEEENSDIAASGKMDTPQEGTGQHKPIFRAIYLTVFVIQGCFFVYASLIPVSCVLSREKDDHDYHDDDYGDTTSNTNTNINDYKTIIIII